MTERPELQQLLLALIAPKPAIPQAAVTALDAADWEQILSMVHQHSLGPLLHWQLSRTRPNLLIPEAVKAELAESFKQATRRTLVLRHELLLIHHILTQAGIPHLALKGAYLAFHAYPQPGLRPMGDLDILVPREQALRAYEVLIAGGLVRLPKYPGTPAAQLQIDQHLPPLHTASGQVVVELHSRLFRLRDDGQGPADLSHAPAFWQRCLTAPVDEALIAFPAPTDFLLHLIVHAAYRHRFSNGPLVLSDIACLLETQDIDWSLFWRLAEQGGYQRGCWLTLRLVEKYWGAPVTWPETGMEIDAKAVPWSAAALLMLRDRASSNAINLVASTRSWSGKARILLGRFLPSRTTMAALHPVTEDSWRLYLYYPVLWQRLIRTHLPALLRSRRQRRFQHEVAQLEALERWL